MSLPRSRSGPFRRWSLIVAAVLGAASPLSPPTATAAPTSPAIACQAAKLLAAGAEAYRRVQCSRQAAPSTCVRRAGDRRADAFRRLESGGGCTTEDDSPAIGRDVEELADTIVATLAAAGASGSRCTAQELSASARAIVRYARAEARDKRRPNLVRRAHAIEDLRAQLATAFATAAASGDCRSAATSEDLFSILYDTFNELVPKLFPEPCPCFTSEGIDAVFEPGYFEREGRGGAACVMDGDAVAVGTSDGCTYRPPVGSYHPEFPRAGVFANDGICTFSDDLDPDDDGSCAGIPYLMSITRAEAIGCAAAIKGSKVYRRECE